MKILLFDMDGVLLEPRAYHRALSETVSLVAGALGFHAVRLSREDIACFEAAGVTNEWDSAAICAALLLRRAWQADPSRRLPPAPPLPQNTPLALDPPDFQDFFRAPAMRAPADLPPLERAERALLAEGNLPSPQHAQTLRELLQGARSAAGAITHRLQQELVLGSRSFTETYGLPPALNVPGYLHSEDRPTLDAASNERLKEWLRTSGHGAAVLTNRPSLGPDGGQASPGGHVDTPEAEIGLRAAGLQGLPILGAGELRWLAGERGRPPQTFLKPSPIHALAALLAAAGVPVPHALRLAAALALDGERDPLWERLQGAQAYIFEDAAKGLASLRAAQAELAARGVALEARLLGVTDSREKASALREAGGLVFASLAEALAAAILPRDR